MDEENISNELNSKEESVNASEGGKDFNLVHLPGMYKDWFLDYASYVILERAVPNVNDGLKPVQRRILHAMKRIDDGRYNKVANLIGQTMQYHPHGDASIGDALVQLGQKELLIDMQGNWGNVLTGDSAAAPRYIEARLSKFANEVVFNNKTTEWTSSYDGRNKEPVTLPVKFPLLLAQGVEGIAVGLASKILPHNFIELIDASIAYLKNEEFELFPDFPTGGMMEVSKYNDGLRGGNVRVRARIEKNDKKSLVITELPFGKTTTSLIESILKANDKGKIKIKKIDDNTAANVEIVVHLAPGVSSDKTIDALYAFTDCEISISPNACVIDNDKPRFIGVSTILKQNTDNTLNLLKLELQIRKDELLEDWHFSSLEKIFIEKRIYRKIENCETFESIIETIDKGLDPYKKLLRREVTRDDIIRLTEIKIKRISKYDSFRADEHIKNIEEEIQQIDFNLNNIVDYTIDYYQRIRTNFGKGRERKTEIRNFDTIIATKVAVANEKLFINRKEGFIGTGLKKEEYICDCSDIDDIIIFRKDGKYLITKINEKSFVGKDIIHAAVFRVNDTRTIYNVVYRDGRYGASYMKRFYVKGITRDKEYDVTKGNDGSRILYFSANPNGEAELIRVLLKPKAKLRKLELEFDFGDLAIKGRGSQGNILTKNAVHKILLKEKGLSTLGGRKIWFDHDVNRLNADERGDYLGEFFPADKIFILSKSGYYRLTNFDLSNHFEEDILLIEKFNPKTVLTVVHYDGEQEYYYLKRFEIENNERENYFINNEHPNSKLISFSTDYYSQLKVEFKGKHKDKENLLIDCDDFIAIKSHNARGKRISTYDIGQFNWLETIKKHESELEPEPTGEEEPENDENETPEIQDLKKNYEAEESVTEAKPLDPEPETKEDTASVKEKPDKEVDKEEEKTVDKKVKKKKPLKKASSSKTVKEDKNTKGKTQKTPKPKKSKKEEKKDEIANDDIVFEIEDTRQKEEKKSKKGKSDDSQMSLGF